MRGAKESDAKDVDSDVSIFLPEIMCVDQSLERKSTQAFNMRVK